MIMVIINHKKSHILGLSVSPADISGDTWRVCIST